MSDDPPHDVLAAEEFSVPAGDPSLHVEPAHDVLAAEEFEMPAGDPALHHGPVRVPAPPFDEGEPAHDVLAAEEFAVPAGRAGSLVPDSGTTGAAAGRRVPALVGAVGLGLVVTVLLRRRR